MTSIPQDLADALRRAGLSDFFAGCTRPHQNEYLRWISDAKRPETRQARIAKSMRMLADKCAEEKVREKTKAKPARA